MSDNKSLLQRVKSLRSESQRLAAHAELSVQRLIATIQEMNTPIVASGVHAHPSVSATWRNHQLGLEVELIQSGQVPRIEIRREQSAEDGRKSRVHIIAPELPDKLTPAELGSVIRRALSGELEFSDK